MSPRLRVIRDPAAEPLRFTRDALPAVDLKSIIVERGILTVVHDNRSTVAENLHLEVGFSNTSGEASLSLRRLKAFFLNPPVEISNLSGLALSREDILLFQDVQLSSPRSSLLVNGEVVGLHDPQFRFDLAVDSLSLDEAEQVTGVELPPATLWLSGRVEGERKAFDVTMDWVAGGAAGDLKMKFSNQEDALHSVEMRGREVDLTALMGLPVRGDFEMTAEGTGLTLETASGLARACIASGAVYGVPIDSLSVEVLYAENAVIGAMLLDGDVGTFYGSMQYDQQHRLRLNGHLAGVDLSKAGGPDSQLNGELSVSRALGTTRIELNLSSVLIHDFDAGKLVAELSHSSSEVMLESLAWTGENDAFRIHGSGHLWRQADDQYDVAVDGQVSPTTLLRLAEGDARPVSFVSRVWNESLAFGATRERIRIDADLSGFLGLDSLVTEATAEGGRILLDHFQARGPSASLDVQGELILESAFDLQATYTAADLEGIPKTILGDATGSTIRAKASAIGPWDSPEVLGQVQIDTLHAAGAAFEGLTLDVNVPLQEEGGASLHAKSALWGGRELRGFYAEVGIHGEDISFLTGNPEGSENHVSVWGGATLTDDSLSVRVDSAMIQLQDEYVANQGPISLSHTRDAGFVIHQLHLAGPSGELEAAPQAAGKALDICVNEFRLQPWAFLVGMDDRLEGKLSGGVSIGGEVGDWTTSAVFEVADSRIDSFKADAIYCEISYHGDRAQGKIGARVGSGDLYLEGMAEMNNANPDWEVDLRAVAEAFPLAALNGFWPQITDIDGELSGQVWMTGLARSIEVNGDLAVSSGQFRIPSLNRGLTGVQVEVDVSTDALTFSQFEGDGLTGTLSAVGTIGLNKIDLERVLVDPLFGALNVDLAAVGLDASATPDLQATIEGAVGLTGTLASPLLVGRLVLQKAEIRLLSMLEAPPDPESIWRVIPFFENLQCQLQLSAERHLWVRDDLVNVELSGDVDVLRDLDDLSERRAEELGFQFFGTMNSLRGTYRFQSRSFRVWREGELRFLGEQPVDPEISLEAYARFPITVSSGEEGVDQRSDINMTVLVLGSFAQPKISLIEDHPDNVELNTIVDESRQAELLSYILFGRSPDQLIAAEQSALGEQSAGLVLGLATRELQSRIAASLNLDMVQVEMGGASTIDRVRVGKYIGDRLFVTYEDQIGQGREFVVEYELLPRFSLESSIGETPDGQVEPSLRLTWGKDW